MSEIKLQNVSKSFGKIKALDDVCLTFEENKIYGLLGRNGAGKTTMLSVIGNRIFSDSGEVLYDESQLKENDAILSNIYIMGEKAMYPKDIKIEKLFKITKDFYHNFDMDKAMELSKAFKLDTKLPFKKLSTGYSTIAKNIIALCVNTPFVFFDEPILGLDAHHRELFYKSLITCYSENQSTFIISTHLIDEVANVIERVIMIDEGKILMDEDCESLKQDAYTITGNSDVVDNFTKTLNVIGYETMGNIKAAYVLGRIDIQDNPKEIDISKTDLQKLFIELTKGGGQL